MENGVTTEILTRYQVHLTATLMSQNAVRRHEALVRRWLAYLGDRRPEEATREDAEAFVAQMKRRGLAASTIAQRISVLRVFTAWGQDLEPPLWLRNPWQKVRRPRVERPLPMVLTNAEVEAILAACERPTFRDALTRALVSLLYGCGLRISEAMAVKVDDVDLDRRQLVVRRGKGGRDRAVPLVDRAAAEIRSWLHGARTLRASRSPYLLLDIRGGPLSRRTAFDLLQAAASRAAVGRRVYPHLLRHTIATHLLEGGADLRSVQEFLGHARLQTTEIYTHVAQAHLVRQLVKAHPMAAPNPGEPTARSSA